MPRSCCEAMLCTERKKSWSTCNPASTLATQTTSALALCFRMSFVLFSCVILQGISLNMQVNPEALQGYSSFEYSQRVHYGYLMCAPTIMAITTLLSKAGQFHKSFLTITTLSIASFNEDCGRCLPKVAAGSWEPDRAVKSRPLATHTISGF